MNLEMSYEMLMLPPQSCRKGNIINCYILWYATNVLYSTTSDNNYLGNKVENQATSLRGPVNSGGRLLLGFIILVLIFGYLCRTIVTLSSSSSWAISFGTGVG